MKTRRALRGSDQQHHAKMSSATNQPRNSSNRLRGNFVVELVPIKQTLWFHRRGATQLNIMEGSVPQHKFKVGQSVSFVSGPFGRGGTNDIYKVMQLLPPEGDDFQYRIKNANEPHERVVKESQLDRIV